MTQPSPLSAPARPKRRQWEAHVYLSAADRAALGKLAKQENRSLHGQIVHLIREGLAKSPAVDPEPGAITNAVRQRIQTAVR